MNTFTKAIKYSSMILMVAVLANCSAKKSATDQNADGSAPQAAPQIDSTPMSFDPGGSDSGKIDGLVTVHFDYDKSSLRAEDKKKIQSNVDWMKAHAKVNVQIEGHCDARGSIEYNLALGERRAKAVRDYMSSLGVDATRLSIISYGKEKPISQGDSDAAYSKNRRANFLPLAQ